MARPAGQTESLYFDAPLFASSAPPDTGEHRDVAIVGAGPVGLTAALELARHGVRSVVLDDKNTVSEGSRAICLARHSLEILQQLGVSERFTDKALGWTRGTSFYRTQPVFRLEMPDSEDERYRPMYNLQQQYIELYLIEAAQAEPLIELRWKHRVCGIETGPGAAELAVETPSGDYRLQANWVIAADGARSAVRQSLGLKLKGEAYEGRYVIADVRMRSDHPTERRAFFDPPANPGGTVLVHRQPDDIWRIDYQLDADDDEHEALREDTIRARVGAIVDMLGETDWELEWWSLYKAYTLCLDDYRHGRVFFAGDAAHLVPIFGVRGLNSGLADAANIGWKLAFVVRGFASDGLLDSYSPERRGATLEVFDSAAKSTRFMTPPTRGFRLVRDAALSLALTEPFARRLLDPRQSQPYNYRASLLTTRPAGDDGFAAGPPAGAPLANRRIGPDEFLLDHLGSAFTGMYFAADAPVPREVKALAAPDGCATAPVSLLAVGRAPGDQITVVDADGSLHRAHDAPRGAFYLVRPDRHVCARWKSFDERQVASAMRRATGR